MSGTDSKCRLCDGIGTDGCVPTTSEWTAVWNGFRLRAPIPAYPSLHPFLSGTFCNPLYVMGCCKGAIILRSDHGIVIPNIPFEFPSILLGLSYASQLQPFIYFCFPSPPFPLHGWSLLDPITCLSHDAVNIRAPIHVSYSTFLSHTVIHHVICLFNFVLPALSS